MEAKPGGVVSYRWRDTFKLPFVCNIECDGHGQRFGETDAGRGNGKSRFMGREERKKGGEERGGGGEEEGEEAWTVVVSVYSSLYVCTHAVRRKG